jgi:hypothetical protein
MVGKPYIWPGSLALVAAIVGTVIPWRIGTNLRAGRTVAGNPRA